MDSPAAKTYAIFIASLLFLTVLLVMILISLLRQFRYRIREYQLQLTREIELIDSERRRMHVDLHDEIGSGLASIGILVQQLNSSIDDPVLIKINQQIAKLKSKIREVAYNFIPSILESHGLSASITDYLDEIGVSHKIKIESSIHFNDQSYTTSKSVHVYRMVREILANALKHAQCTIIRVTIEENEKYLQVFIADNGKGFRYSLNSQPFEGSGLSHIRSRSKILQSTLQVTTSPGKGTALHIQIPLTSLNDRSYTSGKPNQHSDSR